MTTGPSNAPATGTIPKRWETSGAVASDAARPTIHVATSASTIRWPVRRRLQSGTPQARMAATAKNESRNPTSPSQAGFQISMPKAAAASAFSPTYSDPAASAPCNNDAITAARTALGGNPATAT